MTTAKRGSSGEFFDGFAEGFDTFYDGNRNAAMRWIDQRFRSDMYRRFELTFELLGELTDREVLDIGCGSGPYLTEALRRGASRAVGLDPAPGMLRLAERRVRDAGMSDRVELVEGYFPDTQPDAPTSATIVMGVMDYVADPAAFLRQLGAITKERAVLSFPSRHWFRTPVRQFRYWLRSCPVYFYSAADIGIAMHAAGLHDYEIHDIPGAGMDRVVLVRP